MRLYFLDKGAGKRGAMKYELGIVLGIAVIGLANASDTGVHCFAVQQAIGTAFTFDMLQGGFRVPGSSATFRSTFPVSGTIDISRGSAPYMPNTLVLQRNLVIHDVATVSSLGTITGNGYALVMPKSVTLFPVNTTDEPCIFSDLSLVCGGDMRWQAPQVTFTGNCTINGQGNSIALVDNTTMTVASNTSLVLQDVTLTNFTSTKLKCADASSVVYLRNAVIECADNVTTWTGTFIVDAPAVCVLKDKNWTFDGDAVLTVSGFTLWKNQAGAATIGDILGSVNMVNGGAILQQASGNTSMMQNEIMALQGWIYATRHAPMRRR